MIDFKYPKSVDEWKILVQNAEETSNYVILCGYCAVPEIAKMAADLMRNASILGIESATEKYLKDIAALCMEDVEIGIKLYLFLLSGCKSLKIEIENELTNLPKEMSFKKLNKSFEKTNFHNENKEGTEILENVMYGLKDEEKGEVIASINNLKTRILSI